MPYQVDPLFEKGAQHSRVRRRRQKGVRIAAVLVSLCIIASVVWYLSGTAPAVVASDPTTEESATLVQSEETAAPAVNIERMASFIDLRRDPMILRLDDTDTKEAKTLAAIPSFAPGRLKRHGLHAITGLREPLVVAEQRLRVRLPSSLDDFALFNAQRRQNSALDRSPAAHLAVSQGQEVSVREDSSWGDLIGDGVVDTAAVYVETQIENTTSVAVARSEANRSILFEDDIIVLRRQRALVDVLIAAGISDRESDAVVEAAKRAFAFEGPLERDSVVALRLRPDASAGRLMHMSIYTTQGYLASLAQVGAGRFDKAADPWVEEDLLSRSGGIERPLAAQAETRLLDAVYSAGIRNGLPTKLVGEMIVLLSKKFDLERFVVEGDELVLLRATDPGPAAQGAGALLYVGLHTPSEVMACYVMPDPKTDGFACFDFDGGGDGPAQGRLGGGFLVPVKGVKTSGFGPRRHPILKQVRNHNGVDWAAPTGTPVQAAAAGTVSVRGDGGSYGNVIYVDHADGVQTRYAHLNAFAEGISKGSAVAAGQKIGYVGTTGRSTGPHLHFELWVKGRPFDPLSYHAGTGGQTQAVEALVDQIIRVESAGIATAKNPLSTATGLGQFIQSTWLRMMRDYRPDLVRDLDRAGLLALRTDPALSREMVQHLARENEAYLRARGHRIDAGRLYLAHFLGPAGAHRALRADENASVLEIMGKQVVDANPFLRGKNIGALHAWAQRKMGRRSSAPMPQPRALPVEAVAYRAAVDALLEQI